MESITADPHIGFVENWFDEPLETQCEPKEKHINHIGVVVLSAKKSKDCRYLVITTTKPAETCNHVTDISDTVGFFVISTEIPNSLFTSIRVPINTPITVSIFNQNTKKATPIWSAQTKEKIESIFFAIIEKQLGEFAVHQLKYIRTRRDLTHEIDRMMAIEQTKGAAVNNYG